MTNNPKNKSLSTSKRYYKKGYGLVGIEYNQNGNDLFFKLTEEKI
jgi:hypothetical protein